MPETAPLCRGCGHARWWHSQVGCLTPLDDRPTIATALCLCRANADSLTRTAEAAR